MNLIINIPDNATNGDVIKSIFQQTEYHKYVQKVACATNVMKDWWGKPYMNTVYEERTKEENHE